MARYLQSVAFIIALASGARAQVGSAAPEDQVKDPLVMLKAKFAGGESQTGAGIIFAHFIATARHTLWSFDSPRNQSQPSHALKKQRPATSGFGATLAEVNE